MMNSVLFGVMRFSPFTHPNIIAIYSRNKTSIYKDGHWIRVKTYKGNEIFEYKHYAFVHM